MNIKRMIVREGLVFSGFLIIWYLIPAANRIIAPRGDIFEKIYLGMRFRQVVSLTYLFYFFIHFIPWVVGTLRKK